MEMSDEPEEGWALLQLPNGDEFKFKVYGERTRSCMAQLSEYFFEDHIGLMDNVEAIASKHEPGSDGFLDISMDSTGAVKCRYYNLRDSNIFTQTVRHLSPSTP